MAVGKVYFCHECGSMMKAVAGSVMFYCTYCDKHRPRPLSPKLVGEIRTYPDAG